MAYNRRKRKVKKNIPEAQAHIHSTYNNTVVSITDVNGNVISWASAGTIGYKGSKKKTPYAAGMSAEAAAKTAVDKGVKKVEVLPYHTLGTFKWEELNIPYQLEGVNPPSSERVENANKILHTDKYK